MVNVNKPDNLVEYKVAHLRSMPGGHMIRLPVCRGRVLNDREGAYLVARQRQQNSRAIEGIRKEQLPSRKNVFFCFAFFA